MLTTGCLTPCRLSGLQARLSETTGSEHKENTEHGDILLKEGYSRIFKTKTQYDIIKSAQYNTGDTLKRKCDSHLVFACFMQNICV